MVVYCTITNELYLRDTGDCLEVGMQDGFVRVVDLVVTMSVALTVGIKSLELDISVPTTCMKEARMGLLW